MTNHISNSFLKKQEFYYKNDLQNRCRIASPGSQYIIQLIKGGYLENYTVCQGKKVLDIGCGSGFNLVSFAMMGWQTYGCDISNNIVKYASENVKRFGFKAEIVIGENQNIPYPTEFFDLLLSANVIHYVDSEEGMRNSIMEYARVLKKRGRILLLTTHPQNWILKGCKWLGKNFARINNAQDFRNRVIFFVFQDKNDIKSYFSEHFEDIKIGINQLNFFKKQIINFVITGVKR